MLGITDHKTTDNKKKFSGIPKNISLFCRVIYSPVTLETILRQ